MPIVEEPNSTFIAKDASPIDVDSCEFPAREAARDQKIRSLSSSSLLINDMPWIGVRYRLKVAKGLSKLRPLHGFNRIAKYIFNLEELIFAPDMKFRRPGELDSLSPINGIELRWRWDAHAGRMFIDFFRNGACIGWRWDELKPKRHEIVSGVVPDWHGIGHVGVFTFTYSMVQIGSDNGSMSSFDYESDFGALRGYDMDSFLSCIEDELQESSLSIVMAASRFSNGADDAAVTLGKRLVKLPRQNTNRITQYLWLQSVLDSIVNALAMNTVLEVRSQQRGTPLFVVAGGCPNRFCGMQAMMYCQMGLDIKFWWIKPRMDDMAHLDVSTLNKHETGPSKNVAEKSQKLYAPLAEKFRGSAEGNFVFRIDDSGRAIIEETSNEKKYVLLVYLIWQESWSGALARRTFIQGKICYEKQSDVDASPEVLHKSRSVFFTRQYRMEEGRMWIAPLFEEEVLDSLLPGEDFQEMYSMASI